MSLLTTHKVLVPAISCMAWNGDKTRCAISPANSEIWIYKTNGSEDFEKWEIEHKLTEHDHYVTGIDWAPKSNKILSCSQDRNAYVWELKGNEWKPTLVLLRITKAATCCKWSPNEDKFAVGSAAKMVSVCFYEEVNKWYISKMIKKHKSTIKSLCWHPSDNTLLATGSSDMKARTFNTYIKDVDGKRPEGKVKFGDSIVEYASKGWVHDVQFSPNGKWLAFIGHDSTVQFVDYASQDQSQADSQPIETQVVRHDKLPFYRGLFLSDKAFVAVGYDFAPYAFALEGNKWVLKGSCDEKKSSTGASAGAGGAGARSAFLKFQAQATVGAQNAEKNDSPTTRHHNVINSICPFKVEGGKVTKFVTAGLDGKVLFWNSSDIQKNLGLTL
ncbi:hypothetical protein FDP41_006270 [Naegleria fowleri]|uniref:Actin-related protein 2/3 complex subunit n=1 Tax=Naegleria fowleri TaxID=5763 RepID=A0A6A5BJ08_NAEFO|nr:uncharacterized protein FDP41_006270 [Naegleria fowleri]KAF0974796.1 hypothetical protein FDP41_006270 [Naegleria fowleri]